jgi:hypothetical membrane protein
MWESTVMEEREALLGGPLMSLVLGMGIVILPLFVPNYNSVRQTVSEIGEVGSPAQVAFSIMLIVVAVIVLVFAVGAYHTSKVRPRGGWGLLHRFLAFCTTGLAFCSYPRPLHNVFGVSELVAYQAPLVIALQWRGDHRAKSLVVLSPSRLLATFFSY